jgi:hypothetical protein
MIDGRSACRSSRCVIRDEALSRACRVAVLGSPRTKLRPETRILREMAQQLVDTD